MKMRLTFKDPDVLHAKLGNQRYAMIKQLVNDLKISEDAAEIESYIRLDKMIKLTSKYMEYGEYITVEFDDETGTARVVPKNE